MKAMPCQTAKCTGDRHQLGLKMLGRASVALPDGKPYLIGSPASFPLVVTCSKCKRPQRYSAADFARLPELSAYQLEEFGALEPLARDAGLQPGQVRDLLTAGVTLAEAREIEREKMASAEVKP